MKTIPVILLILIGLIYLSGVTITLKPFSIKFEKLWLTIGYVLIIIGCVFIRIQGYKEGLKANKENEIVFDFEKDKN